MYGNDSFSTWLLTPSRPDNVYYSSFDMYLASSETEIWVTNGPASFLFAQIV